MRHAVLVMAHGNTLVLENCMRVLDSPEFDFFIHIDKKSTGDYSYLQKICTKSQVILTKRVSVFWATDSQIEAELILMKESLLGEYDYYHLISGADMPIKTPVQINAFFEKAQGKLFIKPFETSEDFVNNKRRILYRYPYLTFIKRGKKQYWNKIQKLVFSRMLRFRKDSEHDLIKNYHWNVYIGENWFSLPHSCIKYIVSQENFIRRYFYDGYTADEAFVISIILNNPMLRNLHSSYKTRCIDWKRGNPYIWRLHDADELLASDALFARKFDSSVDYDVVTDIRAKLLK